MRCSARIRPFSDNTEIACETDADIQHVLHEGVIRDRAYPGSQTKLTWMNGDRRNFRGVWPGPCFKTMTCTLPSGHRGDCAI